MCEKARLAAWAAVLCCGLTGSVPAAWAASAFAPRTMAYVLQADRLAGSKSRAADVLARCGRDIVVIDYSYDGSAGGAWTASQVRRVRSGKRGRKVVAYLSIGEAEDYRYYWRRAWDRDRDGRPDAGAPAFLCEENPDWEGNYKVRYWHAAWQSILYDYVGKIIAQGFDGLYLDLVDAYEHFEYDPTTKDWIDNRPNPQTGRTYRLDMIRLVRRIASRARKQAGNGFLIIPQNAAALSRYRSYRQMISAIGIEDLFTEGNKRQPRRHPNSVLPRLERIRRDGKAVLLIEYGTQAAFRSISIRGARRYGFVLLLAPRELDALGRAYRPP